MLPSTIARPIIGIYPTVGRPSPYYEAYKKWLDQAGADSFVMPAVLNNERLEQTFVSMNGFLIPGGGEPFGTTADRIVDRAVAANRAGDYFPVWGTCLGFEWLVDHFANNRSEIVDGFDSEDLPLPLEFTPLASASRTYAATNASLRRWLTTEPITYNAHHEGIGPKRFASSASLADDFNVLATGADRKGRAFVAQVEHARLPIFANQFHPEKIEFARFGHVPTSPHAVAAARSLAAFFVSQAAKNKHPTRGRGPDADAAQPSDEPAAQSSPRTAAVQSV